MNNANLAATLINRAQGMKAVLKERAARVEEDRVVGEDTISEFRKAGFFKILQPKAYGGYELEPTVLADVICAVSTACGSSGWTLAVLALHQWEVQLLGKDAIDDIWGDSNEVLLSSAYAPTGKIEPAEGGFLLSGEWPFSSGCDHAQWAIVGGVRPPCGESEAPTMCGFFVPRSDYDIIDDWKTLGLCGTGSKRLRLENVFVPEHRQHPIFGAAPRPPADASPLYRLPFGLLFGEMLASAAHGMAQGMLEEFITRNASRIGAMDNSKFRENPDIHRYIAETEYVLRSARAISHQNLREAFDAALQNREQPVIDKARHFWELAKSVHASTDACSRLYSISGAHTIFEGDSLQRLFRDLQSATTHMAFNFNSYARNYGGMHMGNANSLNLI